MKERRIKCPEVQEGVRFRVMCTDTGEILECADIAILLRRITQGLDNGHSEWKIEREVSA